MPPAGPTHTPARLVAPGPVYPTPPDLIAWCVTRVRSPGGRDDWAFLRARGPGRPTILLIGPNLSTPSAPVDLRPLAADLGLASPGERVVPVPVGLFRRRVNNTLFRVEALAEDELTVLIDAAFAVGFGLGPDYTLDARLDG